MPSDQTRLEFARPLSTDVSTYIEKRPSEARDLEQVHNVALPRNAVLLQALLRIAGGRGLENLVRASVHLDHGRCIKQRVTAITFRSNECALEVDE